MHGDVFVVESVGHSSWCMTPISKQDVITDCCCLNIFRANVGTKCVIGSYNWVGYTLSRQHPRPTGTKISLRGTKTYTVIIVIMQWRCWVDQFPRQTLDILPVSTRTNAPLLLTFENWSMALSESHEAGCEACYCRLWFGFTGSTLTQQIRNGFLVG